MMIWCFFRRTLNHAVLQALQQILLQMSWMGYTRQGVRLFLSGNFRKMKQAMLSAWYVGSGGFLGAISRYAVTMLFTPLGNKELATLLVNIVGAVLLGGIMGMAQTKAVSPRIVLFFATGYLGALTTFSTFVLEVMMLWNARQFWKLAWYGVGTLVLGLLGVMLGKRLGDMLG